MQRRLLTRFFGYFQSFLYTCLVCVAINQRSNYVQYTLEENWHIVEDQFILTLYEGSVVNMAPNWYVWNMWMVSTRNLPIDPKMKQHIFWPFFYSFFILNLCSWIFIIYSQQLWRQRYFHQRWALLLEFRCSPCEALQNNSRLFRYSAII